LRHRKVVQWGLAYAAAAWGLAQGLAHLVATYHWPEWVQQVGTLLLLIGLPFALVLAWYHGEKGEQRVGWSELTILFLLLLLGGGALWFYGQNYESTPTATAPAPAAPLAASSASDVRASIAVLPFENRSNVQEDAFFVDGIHDDILTRLAKVSALKVISRTSVERFRDTDLGMRQIAQQLGVQHILEGGVQRAGGRVRITVQLIDATSDAHLWAETYDRELSAEDIFAIQSEVAARIAGSMQATLTATEKAGLATVPTQSLEAWENYQIGGQRMATRNVAAAAEAERFFRKAIDLDPAFAPAYTALAWSLNNQAQYGSLPYEATLAQADAELDKALRLDPALAGAWGFSAFIAFERGQYAQAELRYRRAIELQPNDAGLRSSHGHMLQGRGKNAEALAELRLAVELDPLAGIVHSGLGSVLKANGDFASALKSYRRAIEIDPMLVNPYLGIGSGYGYCRGRFDEAIPWLEEAFRLDPRGNNSTALLALFHLGLEDLAGAEQWLERAEKQGNLKPQGAVAGALLALFRGDEARAQQYALQATNPESTDLWLLRDADLRTANYAAARGRYKKAFPELFGAEIPELDGLNALAAIDLALVLQQTGETERANRLLQRGEAYIRTIPRLCERGVGISDVAIHAIRGERAKALAALSEAQQAGWRNPKWRYYRDFDPNLATIRNEPDFKAVFDEIQRDMARQRAVLAARPKDVTLDLAASR
jgi:TolB-like protein/Tfp pilus assembly protein PilF